MDIGSVILNMLGILIKAILIVGGVIGGWLLVQIGCGVIKVLRRIAIYNKDIMESSHLEVDVAYLPCDMQEVEAVDWAFIEAVEAILQEYGFTYDRDYEVADETTYKRTKRSNTNRQYGRHYFCKAYGTEAFLYKNHFESRMPDRVEHTMHYGLSLGTMFEDESRIETSSEQVPQMYLQSETTYYWSRNPEEIEQGILRHLQAVEEVMAETALVDLELPVLGTGENKGLKRRYKEGVRKKWYRYDVQHGCYRYTAKGVRKLTMQVAKLDKNKAPIKQFRPVRSVEKIL